MEDKKKRTRFLSVVLTIIAVFVSIVYIVLHLPSVPAATAPVTTAPTASLPTTTPSVSIPTVSAPATTSADDSNLLLGNPSKAVHSTSSPNNYLLDEGTYVESYNASRGEPNWVSWHLCSSDLGTIDRSNDFRVNTELPFSWQIPPTAYQGSGFDRGHNCPSGDRTSTRTANQSTFLMSNMIPQAPYNNEHTWEHLESYLRDLVNQGNEVYIIMGSYGTGGTGSRGTATTVYAGRVTVPSHIWKVAVVLPDGTNDLKRITANTRVIAVDTPNTNSISSSWQTYVTSVDKIEAATGYDLLSNVPVAIQKVIEATTDKN
jgi:endonuclease G